MRFLLSILALALATGCAGYQLGPTNGLAAGTRSIEVKPFQNDTYEPRLTEAVTTSLRRTIQNDGTYRLATRDNGSYILTGRIVEYDRGSLSFDPRDVLTTRDYSLRVAAKIELRERGTGKVILTHEATGRTLVRGLADLAATERQAIPLMAEELARNITSQIVDGTW